MNDYTEIEDPDNPGAYYTMRDGSCEYVNPIYHSYKTFVSMRIEYFKTFTNKRSLSFADELVLKNMALSEWHKHKAAVLAHQVPEGLLNLFGTDKKKVQIKLLANVKLTVEDFEALLFQAWEKFSFKMSKYIFQHDPVEFRAMKKPMVTFKKSDTEIKKVGTTDMSDNQLKALIEKRNVVVATVLDNGDEWHCLFLTHKSISGQELQHIDNPHMHYVSSAFGLTRDELINNFKQTRYRLDSVHIPFEGYNPMAEAREEVQRADFKIK